MSINLPEAVALKLGYPALQKIDPNMQQTTDPAEGAGMFSQAAIPSVLTAMYRYVQSDEGAAAFLKADDSTGWMENIFGEHKKEAIESISSYSKQSGEDPVTKINAIATEAAKLAKENLPVDASIMDVKKFFKDQQNNILLCLPASLGMGSLLNDDTLDDNTNKMEGPLSGLMRLIGSAFSGPVSDEQVKGK